MPRVDIGSDWYELLDVDRIPRSRARAFRTEFYKGMAAAAGSLEGETNPEAAASAMTSDPEKLIAGLESQDDTKELLVLACVSAWSFGEVDRGVLAEIPEFAFNAIYDACVAGGYVSTLNPDFSTNPEDDSPTTPS